ncbi:MAG: hypothetical protein M1336_05045 [Deltaproteobacteria bacterium]|jgi:hypothetical protein|nr:hypothetical protein [Deltaproteobacteria bacterium]
MAARTIPTVAGLQSSTAIVLVAVSGLLFWLWSGPAAVACLVGGLLVMVNLYLLSVLGRMVLGAAAGGRGKFALAVIPLQMVVLLGLVYILLGRARLNALGFALGVSTQVAGICLEVGRRLVVCRIGQEANVSQEKGLKS